MRVRTWILAGWLCAVPGAGSGAVPAAAQGFGVVEGTVRNEHGTPLAQVQVILPRTGRSAVTDAAGRFALRGVPAGSYRLTASLLGYTPAVLPVTLEPGAVQAAVEVVLERTPLSVPGIQVTATPGAGDTRAVTQAMTQLGGRALEREMGGSIAQTLRNQPGVAVRSMGPGAAAPIIRGLTGDRILVLQDGQRTADLSGSADDHGVTIDPLAAQRVEVVRGPATLLYGNNALGGVVNVISGDLPSSLPSRPEWVLAAQTESAYPGAATSLRASAPLGRGWAATVRGGVRRAGDMRIGDDPVLGERLDNTAARNWNGSLGIGYVGERVTAGGALRAYDFRYGLPVPPGSDPVSLRGARREVLGRGEVTPGSAVFPLLRAELTAQDYEHDEIDGRGATQQTFALRTGSASLLLRQGALGPFAEGAWGVSALLKRYAATGPAALTPAADSRGLGVFGYQEVELGPGGAALQLGGRFDHYGIRSRSSPKFGPGRDREFRALSGSAGVRVPVGEGVSAGVSLSRSFRAPTVEELFSGAPHAGTGSVEFGNPDLDAERGWSAEGVVGVRTARLTGQLAAYRNAVDGYVHLASRGDTVVGGARLPVFVYTQERATLQGVEGALEWAVGRRVVLGATGDYLHAERADGTPLSFMPPARLGALLRWDDGVFSVGGDLHHEFLQDRVGAADELPTPAHTLFRLHAGLRLVRGGLVHSIALRGENLTNEVHREATSRIKDFAPGPGRNLALVYRVFF
ncbi:MAG TPA: TonB-dependent receptor [Longimicrobiaceae bacterium]|nr:TonB-dependent receptor [Longimicrobiaceae bacterium]